MCCSVLMVLILTVAICLALFLQSIRVLKQMGRHDLVALIHVRLAALGLLKAPTFPPGFES
jgi:hypothetical protein